MRGLAIGVVACSVASRAERPTPGREMATALPRAALAAWEDHARRQCALIEARFATVRFAPLAADGDPVRQIERRFAVRQGGFLTADFNGDGRPDFLVVTADQGCAVEAPAYGQAGPPADVILSTAAGYAVIEGFAGWPHPAMIRRRGGRDVLEYGQGGFDRRCGIVMTAVWAWDGRGMNIIERRNDRGDRVDADGCEIGAP